MYVQVSVQMSMCRPCPGGQCNQGARKDLTGATVWALVGNFPSREGCDCAV